MIVNLAEELQDVQLDLKTNGSLRADEWRFIWYITNLRVWNCLLSYISGASLGLSASRPWNIYSFASCKWE